MTWLDSNTSLLILSIFCWHKNFSHQNKRDCFNHPSVSFSVTSQVVAAESRFGYSGSNNEADLPSSQETNQLYHSLRLTRLSLKKNKKIKVALLSNKLSKYTYKYKCDTSKLFLGPGMDRVNPCILSVLKKIPHQGVLRTLVWK